MLNPGRNLLLNRRTFDRLEFDSSKLNLTEEVKVESERFYVTPEGSKYPSVTTILSWYTAGAIVAWRKRVGEETANKIVNQAKSRGTALHKVCELYLDNDDSCLDKALPTTIDLFKPIKAYLDSEVEGIYCQEAALYSDYLKVAGRADGIVRLKGLGNAIIDFKTANKMKKESYIKNYFMQASAYCVMFEEMTAIPVTNIIICMVDNDGEFKVFHKKRDDYIFDFIRVRKLYNEKKGA